MSAGDRRPCSYWPESGYVSLLIPFLSSPVTTTSAFNRHILNVILHSNPPSLLLGGSGVIAPEGFESLFLFFHALPVQAMILTSLYHLLLLL